MVLEFVDGLKSKLADMDEKLDALGSAVGAMHEDVKRLAGRPFLEVYKEWTTRTLEAAGSKIPSEGKCLGGAMRSSQDVAPSTNLPTPIHHHIFLLQCTSKRRLSGLVPRPTLSLTKKQTLQNA